MPLSSDCRPRSPQSALLCKTPSCSASCPMIRSLTSPSARYCHRCLFRSMTRRLIPMKLRLERWRMCLLATAMSPNHWCWSIGVSTTTDH
jgi:hypothetical protein